MSNDNPLMNYELIRRLISHDLRHPLQQNMGLYSILPEELKANPHLKQMEANNQLMDSYLKTLSEVFEKRQEDRREQIERIEKGLYDLGALMQQMRDYNDAPKDFTTKHHLDEQAQKKKDEEKTKGNKGT